MRANSDFSLQNIGDIYFISPNKQTDFPTPNTLLTTNETGAFLWNQLQTETTMEEIVEALCLLYQIDSNTASSDITAFFKELQKIGAMEE